MVAEGLMKSLLLTAVVFASTGAFAAPMEPEEAINNWRAANWTCSSGQDHDGGKASDAAVKKACINLGILTTRLSDAGYCFDAKSFEWVACAPKN